jgi:hypothetical protein
MPRDARNAESQKQEAPCAKWAARVHDLAVSIPNVSLSSFTWEWSHRWPNEKEADDRPVRHLKSAMKYVSTVEVTDCDGIVVGSGTRICEAGGMLRSRS